jgi:hypothetical protein
MKFALKNTITKTLVFDTKYILIILAIVTIIFAKQTNAATYIVDNNSDDGALLACTSLPNDCSLRGAIVNANYSPTDSLEVDLIEFNTAMTITLGGTNLILSGNRPLTINGLNRVTVSGNNLSNVFDVTKGVNLSITGLTLTNGNGGMYYVNNSGGINNYGGIVTLTNTTITGNVGGVGGGINNRAGVFSIINSNINDNKAERGSGISNEGLMNINGSSISGNSTYYLCGSCHGFGGGISNAGGTVNITNTTISRNTLGGSGKGGGILNEKGVVVLTNSTISGNQSGQYGYSGNGGGIYNSNGAKVSLINATIYGNSGNVGGIYNLDSVVYMRNSIITQTTAYLPCEISGGEIVSQGNNITGTLCETSVTGDLTGNVVTNDPKLAPLGFYGGKTETHALLSDSPALNPASSNNAPTLDQRGGSRNGTADIGAFEMNSDVVATLPSGLVNSEYNQTVVLYTVTTDYCVSAGNLPIGLSGIPACSGLTKKPSAVEPSLKLSGMPTTSGTYIFTIKANSGIGSSETNYQMDVLPQQIVKSPKSGRVLKSKQK